MNNLPKPEVTFDEKLQIYVATLIGGDKIFGVHVPSMCEGEYCCIHNPSNHHMLTWKQVFRPTSRVMERLCSHGIAHPDPDDPKSKEVRHACDGCCQGPKIRRKEAIEATRLKKNK